jgi:nucleotidyltransferase substrate binding protein (TIGR01987 family)
MEDKDIRWLQRFDNYKKALVQLQNAVDLAGDRALSNLEGQGLIQAFEFTHELAWKTLKDFLHEKGNTGIYGSKDTIRQAFNLGLIKEGASWMDMIKNRNRTSHTYNEETAHEIIQAILDNYIDEFKKLQNTFLELKSKEHG